MNTIKVKNIKALDAAEDLLKAEIQPATRRETQFPVLEEWEMALAGGGEGVVCW